MTEPLGIGERLRNAREAKGLSLEAMEGTTHIRAVYLGALEDEQFDRLPGSVYARGFLRTYAAALGLDPEDLLTVYPKALEVPAHPLVGTTTAEIPIRPAAPRSALRRVAYIVIFLLASLAGIGVAYLYVQLRQFNQPVPAETVTPPPPQIAPPAQSAPPPPAPVARPPVPPPATPAPTPQGALNIEVRAVDVSWMRVIVDGERVFEGFMRAGETRVWRAQRRLTLRVGNSPAVSVFVNGKPLAKPATRVWEQTFQP